MPYMRPLRVVEFVCQAQHHTRDTIVALTAALNDPSIDELDREVLRIMISGIRDLEMTLKNFHSRPDLGPQ